MFPRYCPMIRLSMKYTVNLSFRIKMPRTYVRKKDKTYSEETIGRAIEDINLGRTVYEAAKYHRIPYETGKEYWQ